MSLTDNDSLPRPPWLEQELRTTPASTVINQSVVVNRHWWEGVLTTHDLQSELFEAPDGRITREQLFCLGEHAADTPEAARRLLWATLAWGTGTRHRHNRRRVTAVARDPDGLGASLSRAAALGRAEPAAAYRELRPGRPLISHLGPPFFTKFQYFAGGGSATHPCLILDSMVARSLRRDCGWSALRGRFSWPSTQYATYCDVASQWARELAETRPGEPVRADQIEYVLFQRGKAR